MRFPSLLVSSCLIYFFSLYAQNLTIKVISQIIITFVTSRITGIVSVRISLKKNNSFMSVP